MKKNLLTGLAIGAMMLGVTEMANANLVVNGSFENPPISGTWAAVHQDNVPGWSTVDYFSGEWVSSTPSANTFIEIQKGTLYGAAADGNQFAELDYVNDNGKKTGIYQSWDDLAPGQYDLTFAFSPRPTVTDNTLGVYIDSAWNTDNYKYEWHSFGPVAGNGTTSWTYYTISFTSLGGDSAIAFFDLGADDSLGTLIDDVSMNPVPEPATMFLLGTGLVGLAGIRRKKKA